MAMSLAPEQPPWPSRLAARPAPAHLPDLPFPRRAVLVSRAHMHVYRNRSYSVPAERIYTWGHIQAKAGREIVHVPAALQYTEVTPTVPRQLEPWNNWRRPRNPRPKRPTAKTKSRAAPSPAPEAPARATWIFQEPLLSCARASHVEALGTLVRYSRMRAGT